MSSSPYHIPQNQIFGLQSALARRFPIHAAIYNEDIRALNKAIAIQTNGILLNEEFTPFVEGVKNYSHISKLICYRGATPLEFAILLNSTKCIQELAKTMFVNFDRPSTIKDAEGLPPLHFSIIHTRDEDVSIAIINSQRANLNEFSDKKRTAAHYAALMGFKAALAHLSFKGANLNLRIEAPIPEDKRYTPIQLAVMSEQYETAEALLNFPGVTLDDDPMEDDKTYSIIQHAIEINSVPLLKAILQNNPKLTYSYEEDFESHQFKKLSLSNLVLKYNAFECFEFLKSENKFELSYLRFIEKEPKYFPHFARYLGIEFDEYEESDWEVSSQSDSDVSSATP